MNGAAKENYTELLSSSFIQLDLFDILPQGKLYLPSHLLIPNMANRFFTTEIFHQESRRWLDSEL